MYLEDLINSIEQITTIPANLVSLKVVDDTAIRRIDRQTKNADNPNIKNTLNDVKLVDNSALLVEMKDENQAAQEEEEEVQ